MIRRYANYGLEHWGSDTQVGGCVLVRSSSSGKHCILGITGISLSFIPYHNKDLLESLPPLCYPLEIPRCNNIILQASLTPSKNASPLLDQKSKYIAGVDFF